MRNLERVALLRAVIDDYLAKRLADKAKASKQDASDLTSQYETHSWIKGAAARSSQLKLATHILKASHPDAKGTNIYCSPASLPQHRDMGTRSLSRIEPDVVGNAAALDVYGLLSLRFEGQTIFELMERDDEDLLHVISPDLNESRTLVQSFLRLREDQGFVSTDTLAKQLYWLVGDRPDDDSCYHLLAPLYASSLAQEIWDRITTSRFGEEAKEARALKRKGEYSPHVVSEYRNLAVQKLGGSKPQNISKLNSVRKGINYLLASLPPVWKSRTLNVSGSSLFDSYLLVETNRHIDALKSFLLSNPPSNMETRDRRDQFVHKVVAEILFVQYRIEEELEPGWSRESELDDAQQLWLDPRRAESDAQFALAIQGKTWRERVSRQFATWFNSKLDADLPVGDVEHIFFREIFEDVWESVQTTEEEALPMRQ